MDLFDLSPEYQEYLEEHSTGEDAVLKELRRQTFLKVTHPRMIAGPVQGKFLELISKILRPARILEVGTFTGYSAICLARGLETGGLLYTIEVNDELEDIQKHFFRKAGLTDRIISVKGNALEILPDLNENFDLIFIDGNKEEYCSYYKLCHPKLKSWGIMMADNVLWSGKVINDKFRNDKVTLAIEKFNTMITRDKTVENTLIPMRDGLMLIRKI